MPKTVRYCINCGTEIGDALICTNAECGGLPNFYRNVPGPESTSQPGDHRQPPVAAAGSSGPDAPAPRPGVDRRTMPLTQPLVAMLRSVEPPAREHLISLGITEIGACPPATVVIDRPEVSRRHARIECLAEPGSGHRFYVEDLKSTNGTFLNGRQIQRAEARPGDRIRFGRTEYELCSLAGDAPRVTLQV